MSYMKKTFLQIIFTFSLLLSCNGLAYEYSLSIGAIFQNEAPYLKEWIEFHKLVGVRHFYLYNNQSSDDYLSILQPYIDSGTVELIEWPCFNETWKNTQCSCYQDVVKRAKNESKWLALIDLDEFLFPVEEDSLEEFLLSYEDAPALCVNWAMFGTAGVKELDPSIPMIQQLTKRANTQYHEHKLVKSIVRPEYVKDCFNPHYCTYIDQGQHVDVNKKAFKGLYSPSIRIDKVRINHYWTRDEKYFLEIKLPRVLKRWNHLRTWIERAKRMNKIEDELILKYLDRLKVALEE